ncbi:hypothetical protein L798_01756 [Zootermopsis nevadensis]|uniref:Uncharacterized protein n=1 Tax=Zootermopsis nevadensis TaxID=136037 RepID=A0A067QVX0_ZOONE|nr:hypothetical protein L798_01756 [Zootermopsis nevadensis]
MMIGHRPFEYDEHQNDAGLCWNNIEFLQKVEERSDLENHGEEILEFGLCMYLLHY